MNRLNEKLQYFWFFGLLNLFIKDLFQLRLFDVQLVDFAGRCSAGERERFFFFICLMPYLRCILVFVSLSSPHLSSVSLVWFRSRNRNRLLIFLFALVFHFSYFLILFIVLFYWEIGCYNTNTNTFEGNAHSQKHQIFPHLWLIM